MKAGPHIFQQLYGNKARDTLLSQFPPEHYLTSHTLSSLFVSTEIFVLKFILVEAITSRPESLTCHRWQCMVPTLTMGPGHSDWQDTMEDDISCISAVSPDRICPGLWLPRSHSWTCVCVRGHRWSCTGLTRETKRSPHSPGRLGAHSDKIRIVIILFLLW